MTSGCAQPPVEALREQSLTNLPLSVILGIVMATGVRYLALRFTIPAAVLAAMVALALLFKFGPESYYYVLRFIGIRPFGYPFLDLQIVPASVECWQHGIDVYDYNPCDVLNRTFAYSPLWLYFTFLPGKDWTNSLGLCLSVSFVLALAILPAPRSRKELLLRLLATL